MSKIAAVIGRVLIGILFIVSGFGKLVDLGGTASSIAATGLPSYLALPVGIFELVAGLALAAGFAVRLVALALAVFTAATILFFHNRFTDPAQAVHVLKNLAIIGGLALAFAHSQMWWHYYSIRNARRGELASREAERRAHEAELRAARAEAAARAGTAGHTLVDTDGDGIPDRTTRRRRWFDW